MVQDNLFLLLRVALGTDRSSSEAIDALRSISVGDWNEVFALAERHSVLALAIDGWLATYNLSTARCVLDDPENKMRRREILSGLYNYEHRADSQKRMIAHLSDTWSAAGCRGMLMKGQAVALYYPEPMHRATGDIDVFMLDDAYEECNRIAAEDGAHVVTNWYKHSQIHYKNEMIENHRYLVHTRDGKRGKALDAELKRLSVAESYNFLPGTSVCLPPVEFNALFLAYHGFAHFISEGMRFKQVLDWAMFLKAEWRNINWKLFYEQCDKYHLHRFVDVMNDIAVNKLGVLIDDEDICASSKYTTKVLNSVLFDEDYVFSSGKGGWKNRFHIVTNMIKYSWKYHKIYQESIIRQLWFYTTGYLFHTE